MSADPEDLDAWEATLSRIESDLARRIRRSGTVLEPWKLPTDLGPLPTEFEQRARRILRDQESALARLTKERIALAVKLSALRAIPGTVPPRSAVYLDRIG